MLMLSFAGYKHNTCTLHIEYKVISPLIQLLATVAVQCPFVVVSLA